jgi:hypothetical protein
VWSGDYDDPKVISHRRVKARKKHECCECHREISPGERYEKTKGLWDEHWDEIKICADCVSVIEAFFCDGGVYGRVWQDLENHFDYNGGRFDSDCLTKLTASARAKVCDVIEACWQKGETK